VEAQKKASADMIRMLKNFINPPIPFVRRKILTFRFEAR
jgi:hypothetical protein